MIRIYKAESSLVLSVLVLPTSLGCLLAISELATGVRIANPLSLVYLGLLVGLLLASGVYGLSQVQGAMWLRLILWVVPGLLAVNMAAWITGNRVFDWSIGRLSPETLLLAGLCCAAVSMSAAFWSHLNVVVIRRWSAILHFYADGVCLTTTIFVAVAFRLSIMFRAPVFVIGDSGAYVEAAESIRTAFSFAPLSYIFPPGYPTFLAGTQILFGPDFLAVAAIQHLLGVGTAVLTYKLGREFLPPLIAVVPALGVAANGYLLILEHGIYTEALFIPLALVFALLTTRMLAGAGWWVVASSGAMLGFALLTRLVIQPASLGVCLLLLAAEGFRRRTLLRILVFATVFGVVVAPWIAYNWFHKQYFGITNSFGYILLVRLWEEEGSYTWADTDEHDPDLRRVLSLLDAEKARDSSHSEAWQRVVTEMGLGPTPALITAASLNVISRHPSQYLERTWFRTKRMLRGGFGRERVHDLYAQQELLGIRSPIFGVRAEFASIAEKEGNRTDWITRAFRPDTLPLLPKLALTISCAVSVIFIRPVRPAFVPLAMALGLLLVPVLVDADRARFRHPAEPFLLLTYAGGIWAIWLAIHAIWNRLRPRT